MKSLPLALTLFFFTVCNLLAAEKIVLNARSQTSVAESGKKKFKTSNHVIRWEPSETAIVVCDMWDNHWCKSAARRVNEMAPHMNEVISIARERGVLIIHCPSGCMKFYKNTPMRKIAQRAPEVKTNIPLQRWCSIDPKKEASLPIDDSDGGCDCQPQCKNYRAWTHQNVDILIDRADAITDSAEAYYLMRQRGIKNVIVMGVHLNMCVLGRPFSIRQMVHQGQNLVFMRDMTDSLYNPRKRPFVSHFEGNRLLVQHIERYWAPSISSSDFTGKSEFKFKRDK